MAENVKFFPGSEIEALALLYVQNQDLSGLTPEEIYDKYRDAYRKIHSHKNTGNQKSPVKSTV